MNDNNISQKEALLRIKIARGHLERVIKMVESDDRQSRLLKKTKKVSKAETQRSIPIWRVKNARDENNDPRKKFKRLYFRKAFM